jgi:hypothetical protein
VPAALNFGALANAVIVFEDGDASDSRMKLENGYVFFFNMNKRGPLKVGDFELAKGERARIRDGTIVVAGLLGAHQGIPSDSR